MCFSCAPMASRMPISRVRSVTDTSMMFMMPMPPTSRLTPATAPSMPVMVVVALAMASAIWVMSRTSKLSSRVGRDAARLAQDRLDARPARREVGTPSRGGDVDGVDVAVAGDAALEGGERHHDDIVLVLAEARRALALKHADDLAAHAVDADRSGRRDRRRRRTGWRTVSPMTQTPAPPRTSDSVNDAARAPCPSRARRNSRCRCR